MLMWSLNEPTNVGSRPHTWLKVGSRFESRAQADSRRLVSPNKGFKLVRELLQIEGLGDTASSGRVREKEKFQVRQLESKEIRKKRS